MAESTVSSNRIKGAESDVRASKPQVIKGHDPKGRDLSYTQNRELSWLRFDERVLEEALDESVPLFERIKFVSIFESNLDEFFMIRVGGLSSLATLKHQPRDNKSGLTPAEQVEAIFAALPPLYAKASETFRTLENQLVAQGVERLTPFDLIGQERDFVRTYFNSYVLPIISPLVIDPRHPFPNLRNGALYVVCTLSAAKRDEDGLLGLIEIPMSLPRLIRVPTSDGTLRYILLEDVIMSCIDSCFGSYTPNERAVIRVIRNADLDPDGEGVEEDEDYRQHMKKILKKRLRLQPVFLAIHGKLPKDATKFIRKALKLPSYAVLSVDMPLDLDFIFGLEDKLPANLHDKLLFEPFSPQPSPLFKPGLSMREQVCAGDKLLFYPYESMNTLLDLVNEAAHDDACISLRITLYRVARQSRLCESLISAAEAGKEVTVLMELRARFDEENNIMWAGRLEEAGCTVIYGSEGFKCHSKICQLTYSEGTALTRITLLGTGNFNEKTAKIYSDFMLMTAHPGIGEDANSFFRNLSLGNLSGDYRYLGVAPAGLKPLIMDGLNREIERARGGMPARAFFKMNSLTDREVIDKIAEASQAGVRIEMIIRGISCMLPGIPGRTENVHIRSIVGRFLEHARVYAFGEEADTVYLSSADMMTRNTEHRVEIAYPVLDPQCRAMVCDYMTSQLRDNVKARVLTPEGTWAPVPRAAGEADFNAQEHLMQQAMARAAAAHEPAQTPAYAAAPHREDIHEAKRRAYEQNVAAAAVAAAATSAAAKASATPAPSNSAATTDAQAAAPSSARAMTPQGGNSTDSTATTAATTTSVASPVSRDIVHVPASSTTIVATATPSDAPRNKTGKMARGMQLIAEGLRTIFGH